MWRMIDDGQAGLEPVQWSFDTAFLPQSASPPGLHPVQWVFRFSLFGAFSTIIGPQRPDTALYYQKAQYLQRLLMQKTCGG